MMSTKTHTCSEAGDMEEHFELHPNHAYTFPFLSPNIYERDTGDATSQTSLLSRSSTPPGDPPSSDDVENHELQSLLPWTLQPGVSHFVEDLRPLSQLSKYDVEQAQKYVSWGVSLKQPIIMVVLCAFGTITAARHHLYYYSLMDLVAGSVTRQQWVIWVGTGLNNLTLFLLNSANGIALTQAIWFTVKRHTLSIGALDNLFTFSSDITGFINMEILKRAKLAVFLAFVCWSMVLSAIVPPGTISIIPGPSKPVFDLLNVPTFNWTSASGDNPGLLQYETFDSGALIAYPGPQTMRIASQVAQDMFVSPPSFTIPNSTYTQQFFGPALQCNPANPAQQIAFDYYNEANYNQTHMITVSQFLAGNLPHGYNYIQFFSAFSPQLYGFIDDVVPVEGEPDYYSNWQALLPEGVVDQGTVQNGAEIWIQLSDSSIVCSLTNTSFSISFDATHSTSSVVQNSITHLNAWTYDNSSANYLGVMASLGPMLYGNVTTRPYPCDVGNGVEGECYILSGSSSAVLQTGIGACEEFSNSWWSQNIDLLNATHKNPAINFGTQPWMCRNGSVAKAIEDLAINVTIGLLGLDLPGFKPEYILANTTLLITPNIYAYDFPKLLLSYGCGIIATLICTIIGLIIFRINGISHDTSFSAIMTTTRNPDLDRLSVGQSLSAIERNLERTKLRFGGTRLEELEKNGGTPGEMVERAAFGMEGKVKMLRKGGKYI